MLKLYFAPRTRAIRIRWLLEELRVPHELEHVDFRPQSTPFSQATPFGRIPVLVDGEITIGESGAILEYVLEKYGNGQLAPAVGSAQRGEFLQWVHFARRW
jgi:glutathione S-transferase